MNDWLFIAGMWGVIATFVVLAMIYAPTRDPDFDDYP